MKKYIITDVHGYAGDFYICGDNIFRADNLKIATQIAFNNWLHGFDALYRSCRLVSLEPGTFTVNIMNHDRRSGSEIDSEFITIFVKYYGLANMFEAPVIQKKNTDPAFLELLSEIQRLSDAGDSRVRISNRSGLVIFNCTFPRYHADGSWWSSENSYLDTNPVYAREQLEYALATYETKCAICAHNQVESRKPNNNYQEVEK